MAQLSLKIMELLAIALLIQMFMADMTKPFMHMHVKMHNGGKKRLAKRFMLADLAKI